MDHTGLTHGVTHEITHDITHGVIYGDTDRVTTWGTHGDTHRATQDNIQAGGCSCAQLFWPQTLRLALIAD